MEQEEIENLQANQIKVVCSHLSIEFAWEEYFARFGKVASITNLEFETKTLFSCQILFEDYRKGLTAVLETDGRVIAGHKVTAKVQNDRGFFQTLVPLSFDPVHCYFDNSHPFLVNAAKFKRGKPIGTLDLDLLPDLNFARRDSAISLEHHPSDDHRFENQVVLRAMTNEVSPKPRLLQSCVSCSPPTGISSTMSCNNSAIDQPTSGIVDQNTFALIQSGIEKRSTYMLRNIPNKYTPDMLRQFLDQDFCGEYDFFYLRMDFKNKCNVGYAFLNFINPISVLKFKKIIGKKWPIFKSKKKIALSFATIQGKAQLIKKFQNSSVMLEDLDWRPRIYYSEGPNQGLPEEFPSPTNGSYRPKVDVLFSRLD